MKKLVALAVVVTTFASFVGAATANHSWGNYHWARTSNPFTLKLGDNVSSAWDSSLATTSSDWSQSTVLDTTIVAGGSSEQALPCDVGAGRGLQRAPTGTTGGSASRRSGRRATTSRRAR